ncbi:MAG: AlkA N-terminal domain-containing protein [bacterium]
MLLDNDSCTRALESRDVRFDGVFFVGIVTTGIYCRPICPARATKRKNRRFFSNAAAAERGGFRPCLRCRPELAPGRARVDAVPRLADAAARRIAAGALNGQNVEALATELGVSGRQLRRALHHELGVSPIGLAQTHRLLLAKQLIAQTRLPMTQVAFASGFQSLRRFNALFREQYRLNPLTLRRARAQTSTAAARRANDPDVGDTVSLSLSYRPPLAWDALLTFLAARATPGVELVEDGWYARTISIDGHMGVVRVGNPDAKVTTRSGSGYPTCQLRVHLDMSLLPVLMPLTARLRHLFDLDAEPEVIASHFRRMGGDLLHGSPRGVRVPGAVDAFELAVRAVLGQQVTVKGATTLMGRFVASFGTALPAGETDTRLTYLSPAAGRVAAASIDDIRAIGIPRSRAESIRAVAGAIASGAVRISSDTDVRATARALSELPGIGPWTIEYITMRAAHWPDAFPSTDIVLQRNAGGLTSAKLLRVAESWRPWRAYAAMLLWMKGR